MPLILIILGKMMNMIDWSSISERLKKSFEPVEIEELKEGKTTSNDEISLNDISCL
jgi:hypothetical protein